MGRYHFFFLFFSGARWREIEISAGKANSTGISKSNQGGGGGGAKTEKCVTEVLPDGHPDWG